MSKAESLARQMIDDLFIYTRGKPMQKVPVATVERRLVLKDGVATGAALQEATKRDWLTIESDNNLCLTESGRRLAKTSIGH